MVSAFCVKRCACVFLERKRAPKCKLLGDTFIGMVLLDPEVKPPKYVAT